MKIMFDVVKALCYRNGNFLFLEDRHGRIDLPGGRVIDSEENCEALRREIFEETGLSAHKISHIAEYDLNGFRLYFYFCETDSSVVKLSNEHKGYGWVPVSEALNYIGDGYAGAAIAEWYSTLT